MSAAAILLVAHGARDPRWAAPIERLAVAVTIRLPGSMVRTAYLEFLEPGIAQALDALYQEGVRKVRVVPVFLGAGGHVVHDIAGRVDAVRALRPQMDITIEPPIGLQPQVIEAIAAAIAG